MDLFTKIIDEAATIPQINEVAFAGLAEPLLDPFLMDRLAYTRKAGPTWRLSMYTNGFMLTPEKFDALKAIGLDVLIVSLNAVNAEQHANAMGVKGKFERVCAAIDYAILHRGTMHLSVRAVATAGTFTFEDGRTFLKRWGTMPLGGYGKVLAEHNWASGNRTVVAFDPNETCHRALEQISVSRKGHVNLCCVDVYTKHGFGDLNTQTIREIYNSPEYVAFRELHVASQAAKHPLCAVCTRV